MRLKLQKRSTLNGICDALKFASRIIPGAQRSGKTSRAKFDALVELIPKANTLKGTIGFSGLLPV
jgi:hypothetical protein